MGLAEKTERNSGFTLLELIISITLVAIIVLIVAGAASLGYRSFSSGEKKLNEIERLRASLIIIDAQIQSGVPLTLEDGGVKQYYFVGEKDSLKFSTNHSIWGGQKGYVIVSYKVETDDQGKKRLIASEYKVGMENQKETRLLEGFKEITFDYYRQDAVDEEGEWVTQWEDEEMMPTRIRLNLLWGANSLSYIMPVRVGGLIGELEDDDETEESE
ncbi:MAG TPA: prepilin-type N-terminal cleavage/methylation domain-containing protein [Syntrophorhabdus sp.]|jgi:general secretion pathway protein J|nr:prepilin-type N-terminal cleavage/methylation domain-containing protein [Syntrophorhabdus sp.]OPX94377.1 MAG: general secretion pathway protein J [Syntrophorhabdus sp. PtaB.Bin027]OQB78052.1 MAG: general secretion pathway protein J [Deltaproteobacteria bacterium ADurb.Bin135]HOD78339.1 prepilin-type N-terminal cleavage/methylation domain-containing protein [Syntrophorhabdus sp.]HPW36381.1 prepilin-type N-terminal cleavage/methylation domain-containing protein [Syntrophorhabdus sp.]